MAAPSVSQRTLFVIFFLANLYGAFLNHLDDTDEVHGYYEPLHFLSFGTGLQTWEYAPQFAIRTYAYIAPLVPFVKLFALTGVDKPEIFTAIRILLGTFTAFCQSSFLVSVEAAMGVPVMRLSSVLLFFSPGVLYASTAYLPSATAMSLVMLGASAWLQNNFNACLLCGCVAVCLTGWPFVGVVFLPMGLSMLHKECVPVACDLTCDVCLCLSVSVCVCLCLLYCSIPCTALTPPPPRASSPPPFTITLTLPVLRYSDSMKEMGAAFAIGSAVQFVVRTLIMAALVSGTGRCVDRYYYGEWLDPTSNILAYNAGGNGDMLYGTEPVVYYVRNLLLTTGLAWPLAVGAPLMLFREYQSLSPKLSGSARKKEMVRIRRIAAVCASTVLWCCLLFSRPHKEERFLYPIYPLLAVMGAFTATSLVDMVGDLVAGVFGESQPLLMAQDLVEMNAIAELADGDVREEKMAAAVAKRNTKGYVVKNVCMLLIMAGSIALCFMRCVSVYDNYSGYLKVWQSLHTDIDTSRRSGELTPVAGAGQDVSVCVGGEWYRFASHFHLPPNTRLMYIKDTFAAQLPQYYHEAADASVAAGTSHAAASMNDKNSEESSRYADVHSCDYVVSSLDKHMQDADIRANSPMLRKMTILYSAEARRKFVDTELDLAYFEPLAELKQRVLDAEKSVNPVARAFSVPGYSGYFNQWLHYNIYKRTKA